MALTEKDLPEIVNELFGARSKWYFIGLQLGLEASTLDSIRKDYRESTDNCFCQVIIVWLKSSSHATKTWSTLADVLKRQCIGFEELAAKIEEKFCQCRPQTGKKRSHPTDEPELATKRPHIQEGCNCEDLKTLLLQELISKPNYHERLNCLETSIKKQDAHIQALIEANEELRKENAKLNLQYRKLEMQVKEHSGEIQLQTIRTQRIQYLNN